MRKLIRRFILWLIGPEEQDNRLLFRYWDGARDRKVDPIPAYRKLLADPEFDEERHLAEAKAGDEDAYEICLRAVKRAFAIQDFSEENVGGLTELEKLALLGAFYAYFDQLKKNIETLSTAPPSTESTLPMPDATNTNSTSPCGSIDSERKPCSETSPARDAAPPSTVVSAER